MVTRTKKVFVGGLSAPTTLEDVKNYFQQFGRVSTNSVPILLLIIPVFSFKNLQNLNTIVRSERSLNSLQI